MPRAQGLSPAPEARPVPPDREPPDRAQRSDLCALAAHLMLREIDRDSLAVLRAEGVPGILDRLAPGCAAHLERDWDGQAFDLEAAEYCRLFILPDGVSPFAGAWTEDEGTRRLVIAEVEASATALGLGDRTPDDLPADHLGVLLVLLAEAWRVADADGEPARSLAVSLLGGWLPRFLDALREHARSPLYRALAGLIEAAVGVDFGESNQRSISA